ncbi:MAG: hypothetical protein ACK559_20415, partial [bacterium]
PKASIMNAKETLRLQDIYTNRPVFDLEGATQPDEKGSQHSSGTKRNFSDSLKAKLREPNPYTDREANALLENAGQGLSDVNAAQILAKSARSSVEGMVINLPR